MAEWRPDEDAWLAGFIDGEGHFGIQPTEYGARPFFAICLRADAVATLRQLQDCFGGGVHVNPKSYPGSGPRCQWQVGSKRDLHRLVRYLERFPLRGNKANDLAIWREAVRIYCARGGTWQTSHQLLALKDALRLGRAYEQTEEDAAEARALLNSLHEDQLDLGLATEAPRGPQSES